jgi:hypothetical protein
LRIGSQRGGRSFIFGSQIKRLKKYHFWLTKRRKKLHFEMIDDLDVLEILVEYLQEPSEWREGLSAAPRRASTFKNLGLTARPSIRL